MRYLINTLLSQQMLDAIKHVVDNGIVFQQDTAPVCNQQGLSPWGALPSQRRPIAIAFCRSISIIIFYILL